MTTVNEEIADSYIDWQTQLERFSARAQSEVLALLEELQREIVHALVDVGELRRKRQLQSLLRSVNKSIDQHYDEITEVQHGNLKVVAETESVQLDNAVSAALRVDVLTTLLTDEQLEGLAGDTLIQGAPSADWWKKQSDELRERFIREMRMGVAQGESIQQLTRRVRGTATGRRNTYWFNGKKKTYVEFKGGIMDTGTRQASTLVRTSVLSVANEASQMSFQKNKKAIKYLYAAVTFDLRTSEICIARQGWGWTTDGKPVKETGAKGPYPGRPPWHFNCRTRMLPALYSFEELARKNKKLAKRIDNNVPPDTKASMDGQIPKAKTYEAFLKGKTKAEQIDVLGRRKQELWSEGLLSFRELTDQSGNLLSARQLQDRVLKKHKTKVKKFVRDYERSMSKREEPSVISRLAYESLPEREQMEIRKNIKDNRSKNVS